MKDAETKVHTTKEGGVFIELKDLLEKESVRDMIDILDDIMDEIHKTKSLEDNH